MHLFFFREDTQIIKGLAIIFMMILHVGGSSNAWIEPMTTMETLPVINFFYPSFRICVGIFTFLIGYGYAFARVKDWIYSAKHIWSLLKVFWLILLVITVPTILLTGGGKQLYDNGLQDFIYNLFGISESLNWYSWFVYVFIYSMIALPFMGRLIDRRPIMWTIILIGISCLCEAGLHYIIDDISVQTPLKSVFVFTTCLPTILLGYFFSKEKLYEKIRIPKHWLTVIVALIVIALIFIARTKLNTVLGFGLDFFYAPIFILCVLAIFNVCELKYTRKVLIALGNESVYMWFFHALFFVPLVRSVYQPLIRISDNIFVVTLWAIALTFVISWILHRGVNWIGKGMNKLMA